MAVKKHDLAQDSRLHPNLEALEQYLNLMNEQQSYLPPPGEIVRVCQDIVRYLSHATGEEEDLWILLQSVEHFLMRIMTSVSCETRHEVVIGIIDKFYALISDPQSEACPATSTVLVVIDSTDTDTSLCVARWLVQQKDSAPDGAGLRSALSCLYRWLLVWYGTPSLGDWLMAYIKALEEHERFDILVEVSLDNLGAMFAALDTPVLRHNNSDVLFHMLASLRESTDALDKVKPHVGRILTNLAADSGHWSRELLQNTVDILTATIDGFLGSLKGDALEAFRTKYAEVITCLERHMASGGCSYLTLPPWKQTVACPPPSIAPEKEPATPVTKVGLDNLGNTCYMNSIIQALLLTRQFSTHVLLRMNNVPYWAKMGQLFAKMMYSIADRLNPSEFFTVFRPPFFTINHQHDSSEFLGYLFELLQSYENCSERNHDYSRPPVLSSASRLRAGTSQGSQVSQTSQASLPSATSQSTSENDPAGSSQSRRSLSPRPGSSASSSSGSKRISPDHEIAVPPKKRMRKFDADRVFLRRDTIIDNMFGGVLLTRVQCTVCGACSLSRDVFRDLQLAFPEKPEGWQYSVQGLLEFYCSKERLTGDNKYECRDCGALRDAERSVVIEATPKYLILVLKNFKFDTKVQVQTKLMHSVFHNHTITLPTVWSQAGHSQYTLYSAVVHSGTTLDSGHYFTLGKDRDQQWREYNDDTVSMADETAVNRLRRSSTPYILFYRRNDIEEGAAPALEELPTELQEYVMAHNKYYVEEARQAQICP